MSLHNCVGILIYLIDFITIETTIYCGIMELLVTNRFRPIAILCFSCNLHKKPWSSECAKVQENFYPSSIIAVNSTVQLKRLWLWKFIISLQKHCYHYDTHTAFQMIGDTHHITMAMSWVHKCNGVLPRCEKGPHDVQNAAIFCSLPSTSSWRSAS